MRNGALKVDAEEERRALAQFRKLCIDRFERSGVSTVKASVAANEFASQATERQFATEWLERKAEVLEGDRAERERQMLAEVRRTNTIAIESNRTPCQVVAVVTAAVAVLALVVSFAGADFLKIACRFGIQGCASTPRLDGGAR